MCVSWLLTFIFPQGKCREPVLNERLKEVRTGGQWSREVNFSGVSFVYTCISSLSLSPQGREKVLAIAREVADLEKEMGVDSTVMDGESALKFGLMEVVHEWANGMVRTSLYFLSLSLSLSLSMCRPLYSL